MRAGNKDTNTAGSEKGELSQVWKEKEGVGTYLIEVGHDRDWYVMVTVHLRSCRYENSQCHFILSLSFSYTQSHTSLQRYLSELRFSLEK